MEKKSQGNKRRRKEDKVDERDERPLDTYSLTSDRLRHVKPYVHNFGTNTKGRWVGRTIYDIYASEFGAQSNEYYKKAIEEGLITVDGNKVPCDFVLRGGNHINHCTHRHEPPVAGTSDIEIVADTNDLLVVNKPSTVPMHPCGGYRFNSLFHILDSERKKMGVVGERLHIVHRLDRLTSGLSLFAKNAQVAARFGDDLRAGFTGKTYLARVCGNFGSGLSELGGWRRDMADLEKADSLGWAVSEEETENVVSSVQNGAILKVSQPISCVSQLDGVYECPFANQGVPSITSTTASSGPPVTAETMPVKDKSDTKGAAPWKEAATMVRKLSFNGKTSVVEVKPLHGRTHQIRLHLQFLGHPIANDPCYGGELHYGDPEGGLGPSTLFQDIYAEALEKNDKESMLIKNCRFCQPIKETVEARAADEVDEAPSGMEAVKRNDKERHCSAIWLHAFKYERNDEASPQLNWAFQTSIPEWAQDDFMEK